MGAVTSNLSSKKPPAKQKHFFENLKKSCIFVVKFLKMSQQAQLSSLQLELLRVYALNPNEGELLEIKAFFAKMFSKKLLSLTTAAAQKQNITDNDLDAWLNDDQQ